MRRRPFRSVVEAMPFPMRVQPIDGKILPRKEASTAETPVAKTAGKSRLKRLFERQFPGVLKISSTEKIGAGNGDGREREEPETAAIEPSSVCLDKMVQNFMEEGVGVGGGGERPAARCGRRRCNCFHSTDSSDEESDLQFFEPISATGGDASETLKGLVTCVSVAERNLLADTSKIMDKNKIAKGQDDSRRILTDELQALGYDASVCKSRWEKTPSFPAGEYEYVDVIVDGDRLLVDIDFRGEFEIARSTKAYRALLQSLPLIFVGKPDRLQQIVAAVSEPARQSLKKKGLSFPPWRHPDYMRSKWLASYHRSSPITCKSNAKIEQPSPPAAAITDQDKNKISTVNGDAELRVDSCTVTETTVTVDGGTSPAWRPPAVKPKTVLPSGGKVVTGLASVLSEVV